MAWKFRPFTEAEAFAQEPDMSSWSFWKRWRYLYKNHVRYYRPCKALMASFPWPKH